MALMFQAKFGNRLNSDQNVLEFLNSLSIAKRNSTKRSLKEVIQNHFDGILLEDSSEPDFSSLSDDETISLIIQTRARDSKEYPIESLGTTEPSASVLLSEVIEKNKNLCVTIKSQCQIQASSPTNSTRCSLCKKLSGH